MRTKEGCIFCAIVAGRAPACRVAEDEHALAFLDLFPVADGHTLVIPKDHAENIFEMADGPMRAVAALARRVARAIGSADAAAVSGWIARSSGREALRFVVLADEGGVVRGIADAGSVPPRYASGLGGKRLGWTGFIADYDPAMRYSAYAVLGDGSTSCPLRLP